MGIVKDPENSNRYARHPLVYLVEAADDICYLVMDIEDAHKLKIITTEETKEILMQFMTEQKRQHAAKIFANVHDANEQIGYLRSVVIGLLLTLALKPSSKMKKTYSTAHSDNRLSNRLTRL